MVAVFYIGIVLGISLLRASYGGLRTRNARFLLFTIYGYIHIGLLIPARLYAIATIGRTHWGTRGMHRSQQETDEEPARVLQAKPTPRLPQQRHSSTVMTVSDTREARNVIEMTPQPVVKNVLPVLERDVLGRWRPARTTKPTVVIVPTQRTQSPATIQWDAWAPTPAPV